MGKTDTASLTKITSRKMSTYMKLLPLNVGSRDTVEFNMVEERRGKEVLNITGPGGPAIQGSEYTTEDSHSWGYPLRRAPWHHYWQSYLHSDNHGLDSTQRPTQPCWPQSRPRHLPCHLQNPTGTGCNICVLSCRVERWKLPTTRFH